MALRELATKNFRLKLTALAFATVVWLTFRSGEMELRMPVVSVTSTRDFVSHPVNMMKSAGDTRRFRVEPEEVDITVNGDIVVLKKLSGHDIHAFVDLTQVKDLTQPRHVEVRIFAPSGVRMEKANPAEVRVVPMTP